MSILALEGVELKTPAWKLSAGFVLEERVTGIFGASGAGKTTLLEIIAGLRKPERGKVSMGGEVVCDVEGRMFIPPERRRIGYMPQDLALFPHRTVKENLLYGATMQPGSAGVEQIVDVLGLVDLLGRYPQKLSGGEKQRVALGRALLSSPKLLLLDEPLVNLDFQLKAKLLDLFMMTVQEFKVPLVYVTHDPGELAHFSPEVVLIEQGRIMGQGSFRKFFEGVNTITYQLSSRATVE